MSFDLSPSPAPPPCPNPPPEPLVRIFTIVPLAFLMFVCLLASCFAHTLEEEEPPPQQQQQYLQRRRYRPRTRTTPPPATTTDKDHHKISQLTVTFTYESTTTVKDHREDLEREPQAADGADLCCICLEDFEVGDECQVLVGCNHFYHKVCVDAWLAAKRNCPQCRSPVRGAFSKDLDAIV